MHNLFILPSSQRDLDSLPPRVFSKIKHLILLLQDNPRPPGCVKLTAEEGYRLRSGDYRVLYRVDDKKKRVYVYKVKHRREVYR